MIVVLKSRFDRLQADCDAITEAREIALARLSQSEKAQSEVYERIRELTESLQRQEELYREELAKRIHAEVLAESRRQEIERMTEFARKSEDARQDATSKLIDTLRTSNSHLIDAQTHRDDPNALENFKKQLERSKQLQQLPDTRRINPTRKAIKDMEAAIMKSDIEAINAEIRRRNPEAAPIPSSEKPN